METMLTRMGGAGAGESLHHGPHRPRFEPSLCPPASALLWAFSLIFLSCCLSFSCEARRTHDGVSRIVSGWIRAGFEPYPLFGGFVRDTSTEPLAGPPDAEEHMFRPVQFTLVPDK
eukprot:166557-Rhodomonas_salina.1